MVRHRPLRRLFRFFGKHEQSQARPGPSGEVARVVRHHCSCHLTRVASHGPSPGDALSENVKFSLRPLLSGNRSKTFEAKSTQKLMVPGRATSLITVKAAGINTFTAKEPSVPLTTLTTTGPVSDVIQLVKEHSFTWQK